MTVTPIGAIYANESHRFKITGRNMYSFIAAMGSNSILLVGGMLVFLVLVLAFGRSLLSAVGIRVKKKRRGKLRRSGSERLDLHRKITDDL